jgi:hypothetical protein
MVEPKEVGAELMAAIERLRGLSTEEQEIAYVAFAEKYGAEVATKAKELFEVERAQPKAAEEPKKAPEVEEAIPEVEFHESDFAPEVVAPQRLKKSRRCSNG